MSSVISVLVGGVCPISMATSSAVPADLLTRVASTLELTVRGLEQVQVNLSKLTDRISLLERTTASASASAAASAAASASASAAASSALAFGDRSTARSSPPVHADPDASPSSPLPDLDALARATHATTTTRRPHRDQHGTPHRMTLALNMQDHGSRSSRTLESDGGGDGDGGGAIREENRDDVSPVFKSQDRLASMGIGMSDLFRGAVKRVQVINKLAWTEKDHRHAKVLLNDNIQDICKQ